jgi:hypothetical protein
MITKLMKTGLFRKGEHRKCLKSRKKEAENDNPLQSVRRQDILVRLAGESHLFSSASLLHRSNPLALASTLTLEGLPHLVE